MEEPEEAEGSAVPNGPSGAEGRTEAVAAAEAADADDADPTTVVATETVRAVGHEHVTAAHGSTFELTTDDWLTPAGDCILGIEADRAPADFDDAFVAACRDAAATIRLELAAGGERTVVVASGHPELGFESERSMVVRTSDYVDDRTVAVGADAAAGDLDRALVAALADGAALTCILTVER